MQVLLRAINHFSVPLEQATAAALRLAAAWFVWRRHEEQRLLSVLRQVRDQRADGLPNGLPERMRSRAE